MAASFVMPHDEPSLRFLLVVSGPQGSDTTEVVVASVGATAPSGLHADAGDDQLALVGRQVTLNGSRSESDGQIGYRWIQTGGPTVRFKLEEQSIFAFTPTVPGIYRFALVVASGSEISQPDEVIVTVGAGNRIGSSAVDAVAGEPQAQEPMPTQEIARSALLSLRGGTEAADPLASIFEASADRMNLYRSYSDAFSEMSRRLDDVLPSDPSHKNLWIERVFNPLTAQTVEVMRAEGIDLRMPDSRSMPLSPSQKAALAEEFRLIAEGFRSSNRAR
ncbi:PKD domain-containing protein [Singulisphaera sp. PoT]|uniref:PKD domain-containing protein n=1 Tax=Singulisphaera sp. PoT TaxID=3411797 RepID=UPI003BF581DE